MHKLGRTQVGGIALGVAYGLLLRGVPLLAKAHVSSVYATIGWWTRIANGWVMTVAFLVLGPLILGFLTVRHATENKTLSVWDWIWLPWIAVTLMMAIVGLFAWEGAICVVMALPITLAVASIGGIAAGLLSRSHRLSTRTTACLAVLPFLLAPAEAALQSPVQTRSVASAIRIHASAPMIWHNIERVTAISPAELHTSWAQRIGFPRPVEATLSYAGIGGVRHASFERGLLFIETVTAWEPNQRLAFTIKADSANIPPTTLDEHVTIGGRYFDVLDGEYSLEPLPNGDTMLHLTSHQRLSTDFNGYAGLWSDAVMQSLQQNILQVIQHRCEQQPATLAVAHE